MDILARAPRVAKRPAGYTVGGRAKRSSGDAAPLECQRLSPFLESRELMATKGEVLGLLER